MQSVVNLVYGIATGLGLYVLGVPYPLVWAALGAALRFIPYIGPVIGAGAPILVSLAALPGWAGPLWVMGFFVVLELFTNLVLETVLYAGAAGVSQVALLVSVAFWTWLWGPLGLLMATPLTVCLVVLGKHVPGLEFVGMLMADTPALAPELGYYQRLLARDQGEAADLIEQHIKTEAPRSVYDALLLPALNYAERDRLEQRLSQEEETAVIDATRELLSDAAESSAAWCRHKQRLTIRHRHHRNDSACWGLAINGAPTSWRCRCWCGAGRSPDRRRHHHGADACRGIGVANTAQGDLTLLTYPQSSIRRAIVKGFAPVAGCTRRALGSAGAGGRKRRCSAGGATLVATTLMETRTHLTALVETPEVPLAGASNGQAA
jgi:hypothetical protein